MKRENHNNPKIGIWGYGVMGKSAAHYFLEKNWTVSVMDKDPSVVKKVPPRVAFYSELQGNSFFQHVDYVVVSSGVEIGERYAKYKYKLINELDFFMEHWAKPVIAITGSIGKTSITHILSEILSHTGLTVASGGNIGTPTFDLLRRRQNIDLAVLEVSSFQLEGSTSFSPSSAIMTNFYPNHIDRHKTIEHYWHAKMHIFAFQKENHISIAPLTLRRKIYQCPDIQNHFIFFSSCKPSPEQIHELKADHTILYVQDEQIFIYDGKNSLSLCPLYAPSHTTYKENWLAIYALLYARSISPALIRAITQKITAPPHRFEYVATISEVTFYNDSKSTIPESTLSALDRCHNNATILFLGGKSKGVDRSNLVKQLYKRVKMVYCFGSEAETLYQLCQQYSIPAFAYKELDAAFYHCVKQIKKNDVVLFSPAGSSFDLFTDYKERGNFFKRLVYDYQKRTPYF